MTSVKSRLERLEKEQRFQRWVKTQDILERFTDDELKTYAETGHCQSPCSVHRMPTSRADWKGWTAKPFSRCGRRASACLAVGATTSCSSTPSTATGLSSAAIL